MHFPALLLGNDSASRVLLVQIILRTFLETADEQFVVSSHTFPCRAWFDGLGRAVWGASGRAA